MCLWRKEAKNEKDEEDCWLTRWVGLASGLERILARQLSVKLYVCSSLPANIPILLVVSKLKSDLTIYFNLPMRCSLWYQYLCHMPCHFPYLKWINSHIPEPRFDITHFILCKVMLEDIHGPLRLLFMNVQQRSALWMGEGASWEYEFVGKKSWTRY